MIRPAAVLIAALLTLAPAGASTTVGGLTYAITSVTRTASVGPEGLEERAGGEFIVIRLAVRNVGDQTATISGSDFHLKRGSVEYDAADASATIQGGFFLTKVNPGITKTGVILFDVPASTSPSKYSLEVYGNGGSDPVLIPLH